MLEDNPRDWHRILSETLWAYRMSKRSSTGASPFALTYVHDAVLPMEVVVPSLRIARQNNLRPEDYTEAMITELEDADDLRLQADNHMIVQKRKSLSLVFDKRVKQKKFQEGDQVWKTIFPLGAKDREYGKGSPNWEGPFRVHRVLKANAYWLSSLDGEPHKRYINGKYLKRDFPGNVRRERKLG